MASALLSAWRRTASASAWAWSRWVSVLVCASIRWTSAFVRASTFPTLAQALDGGGEERVERFYDLLEARLSARLAAAPGPNAIPLAKLLLVKQASASA